ncbi:MAG: CsgG/HfaB family protein [Pseudomonadota bacterium]
MRLSVILTIALLALASPAQAAENLEKALSELAAEVLSFVDSDVPKKIAISTMIHGDGTCSDLSERASNRFQGALFRAKTDNVSVIDRRSLSAIFREQDLIEDGTVSPEGAAKIARIAQVNAIVTGTVTTYGDQVELEASMLDALNGTVLGFAYSNFPLTGADEALLKNRGLARCGFARADARPGTRPGPAPVSSPSLPASSSDSNWVFEADVFTAQIQSIFYAASTGQATVTARLRNTSEKPIALSYRKGTLTMTDGQGGLFSWADTWSGLRVCDTNLKYCNGSYPKYVTVLAAGNQAQLTFNVVGAKELEALVLSMTMELIVTPDVEGDKAYKVVSLGFFDLAPTVR